MKVATIKLKNMDLDQVNDFLRFVFNERDIEVLDPDVSFTITTVRDKKDKLADKMGDSGVYHFYINAFEKDDRLIYSSGIEFDFTNSDFRYANITHKLLSSDNPCFQIVKHKDIDFDDIASTSYMLAKTQERVFNEKQMDEMFKEYYRLATMSIEELNDEFNKNYPRKAEQYIPLPEIYNGSSQNAKTYFVAKTALDFLEKNGLIEAGTMLPEINSTSELPLSPEEKEFASAFDQYMLDEKSIVEKPSFTVLDSIWSSGEQRTHAFKKIFDKNKEHDLGMEF